MSEQINNMAQVWWGWMWPMFWQVGVLIGFFWLVDVAIRRRVWPQVRYALWLLVLLKLALPPGFALSTSVSSHLQRSAMEKLGGRLLAYGTGEGAYMEGEMPGAAWASDTELADASGNVNVPIAMRQAVIEPIDRGGVGLCRQVYLMLVWLLGVLMLAGLLVLRFRQLRLAHRVKADLAKLPEWFEEMVRDAAKKLKLRRVPEVVLSRGVVSPAVFGAFRPVLLMPAGNINRLCRKEVEHVLLHELAHIKRGDLKVHAVYMVLQIIYWFNPLLWLVRRQLQHLRELCCDATVARILREKTADYRETILETARRLLTKPVRAGIGLLGLFEDSSRLSVRLKWLEKKTWKNRGLRIATIGAVVAVMCVCVLPMARGRGRAKKDSALVTDAGGREGRSEVSSDDVAESRAWYVMRQWNAGPMLLGLTQQLGKVIVPSRRDEPIWTGVEKGGKLKLNIAVEGDVSGEIFVGFFSDATWSAEPVQVRSFPGPGEYVVEKLSAGKFQVGAMVGTPPIANALGVHREWPEPVEVTRGKTAATKVLVSEDFQKHASGSSGGDMARAFAGDWDKMNPSNLLQGRVTGPDGEPVAYAQIVLHEYKTKRASYRMSHSGTNEKGQFYLDKMDWPYQVQVIWDEKLPELLGTRQHYIIRRRVYNGQQTVNFKFDPFRDGSAVLKGRVVDQEGNAIPEFHLFVRTKPEDENWRTDSGDDYRSTQYRIPFISEDGSFELSGLPGGVFVARALAFKARAYEMDWGVEVEMEAGETTEAELRLKAKNVLYGRVLYEDGKVPATDEVRIVVRMGRGGRGRGVGGVESEGYFSIHLSDGELEAVKAGRCTITIMGKDVRGQLVSDGEVGDVIVGESSVRIVVQDAWRQLGIFPARLLSAERGEAGLLKVPRVPPKAAEEAKRGREMWEGDSLPPGWRLDYDNGVIHGEGKGWRSGMAKNLAELRAVPTPVNEYDESWKEERLEFEILSTRGERMGAIIIWGERGTDHIILAPNKYTLVYTRARIDPKTSCPIKLNQAKFPIDLSKPGMYELKFSPKMQTPTSVRSFTTTCTGTVMDGKGRLLKGAKVAAFEMFFDMAGGLNLRLIGEAVTKLDGKFVFETTPSVSKNRSLGGVVVGMKKGLAIAWAEWPFYGSQQVTITLGRATKVAGVVVGDKGEPIRAAEVRAVLFKKETSKKALTRWLPGIAPLEWLTVKSDGKGRFEFDNIPADLDVDLLITAKGQATTYTHQYSPAPDFLKEHRFAFKSGQTDIKVVLPAEGRIEGKVVDSSGKGAPGANLAVVATFSPAFFDRFVRVSGEDGSFTVAGLRSGKYLIRGGFPSVEVEVESGKTTSGIIIECPGQPEGWMTKSKGSGTKGGKAVSGFELFGVDGKTYRLEDYKGKVVLLNVFATWCGPCVMELPHLLDLKKQFTDKGLVILAISHKEEPLIVESYARRHNLPYPVLLDRTGRATDQFADKWGRISLPTNVLLDRDHKIVHQLAGFSKRSFTRLEEVIEEVLDGTWGASKQATVRIPLKGVASGGELVLADTLNRNTRSLGITTVGVNRRKLSRLGWPRLLMC